MYFDSVITPQETIELTRDESNGNRWNHPSFYYSSEDGGFFVNDGTDLKVGGLPETRTAADPAGTTTVNRSDVFNDSSASSSLMYIVRAVQGAPFSQRDTYFAYTYAFFDQTYTPSRNVRLEWDVVPDGARELENLDVSFQSAFKLTGTIELRNDVMEENKGKEFYLAGAHYKQLVPEAAEDAYYKYENLEPEVGGDPTGVHIYYKEGKIYGRWYDRYRANPGFVGPEEIATIGQDPTDSGGAGGAFSESKNNSIYIVRTDTGKIFVYNTDQLQQDNNNGQQWPDLTTYALVNALDVFIENDTPPSTARYVKKNDDGSYDVDNISEYMSDDAVNPAEPTVIGFPDFCDSLFNSGDNHVELKFGNGTSTHTYTNGEYKIEYRAHDQIFCSYPGDGGSRVEFSVGIPESGPDALGRGSNTPAADAGFNRFRNICFAKTSAGDNFILFPN